MPAGAIFDIDGTLVDTNYLHTLAWRRAFLGCGLDVPSAAIHRMIGAGSGILMKELAGEERPDVKAAWRHHFNALEPEVRALPGAADLLRTLSRSGIVVALASSSEEAELAVLLGALDCDDAIDVVTSSGDVAEAKPSPEVFEVAMARSGLVPESALVVGDTVWDLAAARSAGLPCVCVLTGGTSRAELEDAGAVAVYPDVGYLVAHLDETPFAALMG